MIVNFPIVTVSIVFLLLSYLEKDSKKRRRNGEAKTALQ